MAKFEVTIYNMRVREKVEQGEHHPRFKDDWADFRYVEFHADTEKRVRAMAEDRYPPDEGFVIENIQKNEDGKFE
ncbi:MAG: hypothetical protein IIC06_06400 [Proteobacteria bacterium]|nr:hypothetical protein [Pseudomonadota bacterium]